jgi:tetratricopeptide (TPR) repeat protein
VCDATYVHKTQAAPLLHARLACLDEYLADLRTAVDILAESDAAVAARAIQAASELPAPDRCTSAAGRENEGHLSPETAATVLAVRESLSRIRVEGDAGRRERARELARAAVAQADAAGYAPIEAETLLHLGFTEIAAADLESADLHLSAAYDLAEESGVDHVRAAAATRLVHLAGELRSRDTEGLMWGRVARAAIRRLGSPTQLQVELHANLAGVHRRFGRYADALADLSRAIELDSGATNYRIAAYRARLGEVHSSRRRYRDAQDELEQAIRIGSASLGPQHPAIAPWVAARGWTRLNLGAMATAESDFHMAVDLVEAAAGPDDFALHRPLNGLGSIALFRGDFAAAAATYRRVRELLERSRGSNAPELLPPTTNLAETLHRAGDVAGSLRLGEEARGLCERTHGPDNERCAYVLSQLASAQILAGRLDLAAPLADRSVAILETTQGTTFPELTRPLVAHGMIALARDLPVDALAPLERALVLARNGWEPPLEHAELRIALADALWRADRDRLRARQLALEVQLRLRGEPDSVGQREALARADAWLTAHPAA